MGDIGRRQFNTLVGGAAATVSLAQVVLAQQQATPVIGFLHGASPERFAPMVTALRQGLKEAGYVDGRNVAIEFRWAEGHYDRLPSLAAELVRRQVAVIITAGTPSTLAAKAATATIPIVTSVGIDLVQAGVIASLNRPGGNVTGLVLLTVELAGKRLELLHELLPTAMVVALLVNPTNPVTEPETRGVRDAASALGLQLHVLNASAESEINKAFAILVERRVGALVVGYDQYFNNQHAQIVALAANHAIPAIYGIREQATAGGLMSYGPDLAEAYRQQGIYAGKILKGAKPADLPVQQAVKVEFVINLKTAKTLGLTVPPALIARADKVIQ
jgi:putative tryptophan/tyrosine transport system substrate-binding protein